jgi:DMSO/TMAO reductase YedYZ heme-binding membrane subunit
MPAHLISYFIMLPLMALMIWRRVSRQFGRQPIQRKRMIFRIVMFSFLGCMFALSGLHKIELAEGLLGGVLIGGAIGLLGLRLTRFMVDPVKGDCYVPNSWIGALLTVLVLGRLAWRLMELWPQLQQASAGAATQAAGYSGQPMGYTASPLTMLVLGLYVGYYIVYFSGLLIHHRCFQQATGTTA